MRTAISSSTSLRKTVPQPENPPQDQINGLINLFNAGDLTVLEQDCRNLLKIYPRSLTLLNILGAALHTQGHYQGAVDAYDAAIKLNPDFSDAYSNRGAALKGLGLLREAVASYDKAIELKPNDAEAYNNRGNALKDLGSLDLAVESYDKAIRINPAYDKAYSNRGVALQELGQLDAAVASCDRAIQINPDYAEAYYNRGVALQALGRSDAAFSSYQDAVALDPDSSLFWAGFEDCFQSVTVASCSEDFVQLLSRMLDQPTIRPNDVSKPIVNALRCYPKLSRIMDRIQQDDFDENVASITAQLSTTPLLLQIMTLSPIADLDVEKLFTKLRRLMLQKVIKGESHAASRPFYIALSMHCFINEYVYAESDEERQAVEDLINKIRTSLENNSPVSPDEVAVLAAYRPLHIFPWAEELPHESWADDMKEVITGQIENFKTEQIIRAEIPCLTPIVDEISKVVRDQYEENPYPRWVRAGLTDDPKPVQQVFQALKLPLIFGDQSFPDHPDILIAGCGTGQHALSVAAEYLNANILAMDLSLSSLSYAKRKTRELGVENIEYRQGDILDFHKLGKQFDIIESVGVLHHMEDPVAGWKVLVDILRPGGFMKIGLYSEIARQNIVNAQHRIAAQEYTSSPDDIRRYRAELMEAAPEPDSDSNAMKITDLFDFYSLSECRDLLFHVHEHSFSIPESERILKDLGLKFLGFEFKQSWVASKFKDMFPDENAATSLPYWHEFERKNPDTFMGMYQLRAQKL
jgi:tetratricopeptide (TPR) repeat protein/2-polyprenyl-3-methyl-5-hydroxy-6-metoxy-1,4-benzoquinol methylase